MNRIFLAIGLVAAASFSACSYDRSPGSSNYDPNNPGFEYRVDDMYSSEAYNGWTQSSSNSNPYNPDSSNQRLPAQHTVARGKADYVFNLPADDAGYQASASLVNPVPNDATNLAEGKRLYNIYCWHCHGHDGKNDGSLMAAGKFPKPGTFQTYQDAYIKALPEGKMYHVVTYGKNLMGAHGSLLSPTQRWQIIHYVKHLSTLKSDTEEAGGTEAGTDSTKSAVPKSNASDTKSGDDKAAAGNTKKS